MITYERSTLDERRKVYWAGRSSSNDLGRGNGFPGQGSHGIHTGNQSVNHSRVLGGPAWNSITDLRRRNLGSMALRFAQAACGQVGGVESAQERAPQTGQQKRQDRCAPTR